MPIRFRGRSACFIIPLFAALLLPVTSEAQSGSRGSTQKQTIQQGSQDRGSGSTTTATTAALQGYCPVCIIEKKSWVKGDSRFAAEYDGKTYLFPSDEVREMFLKSPVKYVPALSGDCLVSFSQSGQRTAGSVFHASYYNNRLYLFSSDEHKQAFNAAPRKYVDADLAYGGKCVVCTVEMQQDVEGKAEFTVVHKGLRYQFPGNDQLQMFVAAPEKYEVK